MVPNIKQHTDVKAKTLEYHVILARQFKSSEPTMAVFQSLFAIRTDIQIGASIVCHIQRQEFCNESKSYLSVIIYFLYIQSESKKMRHVQTMAVSKRSTIFVIFS